MAIDPQTAFDQLLDSLEEFHEAVLSSSDPDEPTILNAMNMLSDAYTIYDDMLFRQFGVEGPFDTFDEDDTDFDDDFDEDLDDDFDEDDADFDDDFDIEESF
ncbi:DNA primase [Arcanobacterium canis]